MPDGGLNTPVEVPKTYYNWYDFKRAMESRLGQGLPVDWCLRTKPTKPLPWDEADLRKSLSEVLRIQASLKYKRTGVRIH